MLGATADTDAAAKGPAPGRAAVLCALQTPHCLLSFWDPCFWDPCAKVVYQAPAQQVCSSLVQPPKQHHIQAPAAPAAPGAPGAPGAPATFRAGQPIARQVLPLV